MFDSFPESEHDQWRFPVEVEDNAIHLTPRGIVDADGRRFGRILFVAGRIDFA